MNIGKVYLVGAGIGHPGLITLRGIECLQNADVVIYDRLINLSLLNYAPQAEWIDVGKIPGQHHFPQDVINSLLIEKALEGKTVVRLKGGDPFIFGRGGEEALALRQKGIPYEVVPGVTSAIAAPAYSGIPVTHRGISSGVAILTGHKSDPQPSLFNCIFPIPENKRKPPSEKDVFPAINTLVFLMGVENLSRIVEQLLANQIPPDTPAALIERGSYNNQKTVVSTLGQIVQASHDIHPPAVFVVGDVVKLRQEMEWFEELPPAPLGGLRVINTRPLELLSGYENNLSTMLTNLGAEVIDIPTIEIVPSSDSVLEEGISRFCSLLEHQGSFWLLFTSGNAIKIFFDHYFSLGKDTRSLSSIKIGAIGKSSANILRNYGILPDFIPSKADGKTFAEELPIQSGERVFIPTAKNSMPHLKQGLLKKNVIVEEMITHESMPSKLPDSRIRFLIKNPIDVIVFFSPSAFNGMLENINRYLSKHPDETCNPIELLNHFTIASIGETTASAIRNAGVEVKIVAKEHSTDGLLKALIEWRQKK